MNKNILGKKKNTKRGVQSIIESSPTIYIVKAKKKKKKKNPLKRISIIFLKLISSEYLLTFPFINYSQVKINLVYPLTFLLTNYS